MPFIAEFFLKNWKIVVILLILASAGGYVQYLRVDNADQKTAITKLTADNKTLTDNNAKLQGAITVSNTALDITQKAADKQAKDIAAVATLAKHQAATLQKKLNALLAEKDPTTCQDTIEYLIGNAGGFSK